MQIKVNNHGETTHVSVVNPATDETIASAALDKDQEVVVTAVNAHDAADIQVGEVTDCPAEEPAGSGD